MKYLFTILITLSTLFALPAYAELVIDVKIPDEKNNKGENGNNNAVTPQDIKPDILHFKNKDKPICFFLNFLSKIDEQDRRKINAKQFEIIPQNDLEKELVDYGINKLRFFNRDDAHVNYMKKFRTMCQ